MRELPGLAVPHVPETRRLRQAIDRWLPSRQKMPSPHGACTLVALEVARLLRPRRCRRVPRIEADGDDLEVFSRLERGDAQRAREPVEDERAEHRTVVIREREHDGPRAEVLAKPHHAAVLICKYRIERYRLIQVLIETDLAQRRGHWRRCHAGLAFETGRGSARHLRVHDDREKSYHHERRYHGARGED